MKNSLNVSIRPSSLITGEFETVLEKRKREQAEKNRKATTKPSLAASESCQIAGLSLEIVEADKNLVFAARFTGEMRESEVRPETGKSRPQMHMLFEDDMTVGGVRERWVSANELVAEKDADTGEIISLIDENEVTNLVYKVNKIQGQDTPFFSFTSQEAV